MTWWGSSGVVALGAAGWLALAGCGSAPSAEEAPAPEAAAEGSEEPIDWEAVRRKAEAEPDTGGPLLRGPQPKFAPLQQDRLRAMVEFRPGWKLQCSEQFALMHQVDDATAAAILEEAVNHTLRLFGEDPRASAMETPLLVCVTDREQYLAAGGSEKANAVYSDLRHEVVLLADSESQPATLEALRDGVSRWFKETSPREIEKQVKWLQEWANRRRSGK